MNIETYVDTNVSNVVAFLLHDLVLHCSRIVNTQSGMADSYCTGIVVWLVLVVPVWLMLIVPVRLHDHNCTVLASVPVRLIFVVPA